MPSRPSLQAAATRSAPIEIGGVFVELNPGGSLGEHLLQAGLALIKPQLPQIVAVDFEHVEGEQEHGNRLSLMKINRGGNV